MKAAVIDAGSNSIRLGIYVNDGGLKEIFSRRISTRLAEGLNENNRLQTDAIKRSVSAFEEFKALIDEQGVKSITAVATESLRRAQNSGEFIAEVYEKTGIKIEIIDGRQECCLGAYAAMQSAGKRDFYVLDTGGGSAELSLVMGGEVKASECMPLGCVVLTEKFNPDINGCSKMNEYITEKLEDLNWLSKALPLVVMGGSNKMLGKIMLESENDKVIDSASVSCGDVRCVAEMIISCPYEERLEIPGMEKSRAGLITAGFAPLLCLCGLVNPPEIIFCTGSIREGVAARILCTNL